MPGAGTKLDITTNSPHPPPARVLDISRLISRAGRTLTGVDRVELAYLVHLQNRDVPLFALARTSLGYVLLAPDGVAELAARLRGAEAFGASDMLSRLTGRRGGAVQRAESDLRRYALDRCLPRQLARMLSLHLPAGTVYLNTGHSNLGQRVFDAVRAAEGRIAVLVHDVIPLEYPQYQRPKITRRFEGILARVSARADLVIYNSHDTRRRTEPFLQMHGRVPPGVVAWLGVDAVQADAQALPPDLDLSTPYFVTLGTIEPRKRHDILLDVWDDLRTDTTGAPLPRLFVCGNRGWMNDAVFARLDALPPNGVVRELPGLSDAALAALIGGAAGLLCPSDAEGFGLPPVEAAALGVPVLCRDLPVYREVLGDIPVYLSETDRYHWRNRVISLSKDCSARTDDENRARFVPPDWDAHFNTVLSLA